MKLAIAIGVALVNRPLMAMKTDEITPLMIKTVRKPKRLRTRCTVSFMVSAPATAAQVISPDCRGDMPKPSCRSSGRRKGVAPTPIRNKLPPTTPALKVAIFRRRRSRIGSAVRRACQR